jgi:cytochrome c oxidase assembly protein subunit 15
MGKNKLILMWLILSGLVVISTVIIGGYTRLSNAGLSIVEWKPVTGIFFPLQQSSWDQEFNKYKDSPEYKDINVGMSLDEFKTIYTIEYLHRIVGRMVAIIFIIPFLIFWRKNYLNTSEIKISVFISFLIFTQGFIGWYMVSSGIGHLPFVSHFRLALHLIIAVIIYSLIFWMFAKKINQQSRCLAISTPIKIVTLSLTFMILFQIFLGGLVAGSKAGFVYNTFPRMAGRLIPSEIWNFNFEIENLSNILYIQFFHRVIAYGIGVFVSAYSIYMICLYRRNSLILISNLLLIILVLLQILFGILTLIYIVPMGLALFHQFFSILLLSSSIWNLSILRSE